MLPKPTGKFVQMADKPTQFSGITHKMAVTRAYSADRRFLSKLATVKI